MGTDKYPISRLAHLNLSIAVYLTHIDDVLDLN